MDEHNDIMRIEKFGNRIKEIAEMDAVIQAMHEAKLPVPEMLRGVSRAARSSVPGKRFYTLASLYSPKA